VCLPAIGNAYAVLSNTEKRKQYDQYGEEKLHPSRQRQHRDFEADISPEDLFNMFFGGGFPSSKRRADEYRPSQCVVIFVCAMEAQEYRGVLVWSNMFPRLSNPLIQTRLLHYVLHNLGVDYDRDCMLYAAGSSVLGSYHVMAGVN